MRADGHVEAVEAGQHEEGRAVSAGGELEVQLAIGMRVLVGLEGEEQQAQRRWSANSHEMSCGRLFEQPPVRQVTVTPEVSSSRVLIAGMPHAPIGVNGSLMPGPGGRPVGREIRPDQLVLEVAQPGTDSTRM